MNIHINVNIKYFSQLIQLIFNHQQTLLKAALIPGNVDSHLIQPIFNHLLTFLKAALMPGNVDSHLI